MNILYFTDDRSEYKQGYYYNDWLNVFQKNNNTTVINSESTHHEKSLTEKTYDLVVIGHGAQDNLTSETRTAQRTRNPFKRKCKLKLLLQEISKKSPIIIFSKNDYKAIESKSTIANEINAKLLITHSRQSIPDFTRAGLPSERIEWIPFPLNTSLFYTSDDSQVKDIDIGYRGNLNTDWIGDLRTRFLSAIKSQCVDRNLDIHPSNKAENFLFGETYANWLRRITLFANTHSAVETAGPRFFEAMACGACIIAPYHRYEGLLYPNETYIPVRDDFSDLKDKVDLFFSDEKYRRTLLNSSREFTQTVSIQNQYIELIRTLRGHKII